MTVYGVIMVVLMFMVLPMVGSMKVGCAHPQHLDKPLFLEHSICPGHPEYRRNRERLTLSAEVRLLRQT